MTHPPEDLVTLSFSWSELALLQSTLLNQLADRILERDNLSQRGESELAEKIATHCEGLERLILKPQEVLDVRELPELGGGGDALVDIKRTRTENARSSVIAHGYSSIADSGGDLR